MGNLALFAPWQHVLASFEEEKQKVLKQHGTCRPCSPLRIIGTEKPTACKSSCTRQFRKPFIGHGLPVQPLLIVNCSNETSRRRHTHHKEARFSSSRLLSADNVAPLAKHHQPSQLTRRPVSSGLSSRPDSQISKATPCDWQCSLPFGSCPGMTRASSRSAVGYSALI